MQNKIFSTPYYLKYFYLLVIATALFIASFFVDNFWNNNSSLPAVKSRMENYIREQQNDFDATMLDTVLLQKIILQDYSTNTLMGFTKKKYFFYLFTQNAENCYEPAFWNNSVIQPTDSLITSKDSAGFIQLKNGYYVFKKALLKNGIALALIPVKWNYVVTNAYLKNSFAFEQGLEDNYDISFSPNAASIQCLKGSTLFYLTKKSNTQILKNNIISIALRILGTILILLFIHFLALNISENTKRWKGILFLSTLLFLLRWLSYHFAIPLNFRQFELFDPAIYGANPVLRSLGDLFINTLLFLWIVFFVKKQFYQQQYSPTIRTITLKGLVLIAVALIIWSATFMCGYIVQSMVADSQISFDVINFFTLNLYSVIGFVVLCCVAMGYFVLCQFLCQLIRPLFLKNFIALYFAVAGVGLFFLSMGVSINSINFDLYLLLWVLLFLFLLNNKYLSIGSIKISSSNFIFWLFFFSLSITAVIIQENNIKELGNRKRYAETLAAKADPSSETLMNIILTDFRNETLLANFYKFKTDSLNQNFKDSLVNQNFVAYNNKYETKIYSFDAAENPLFNKDSTHFIQLNLILNNQAKPTAIKDLYYFDEAYDRYSYIIKKTVKDSSDNIKGYIFIVAQLKKYTPTTFYPELFFKNEEYSIENSSTYSFAVYKNLQLINSHNDYPFATKLNKKSLQNVEFDLKNINGYSELWYQATANNVVVIAKKNSYLLESITLFSYLFCAFLLITLLLGCIDICIHTQLKYSELKNYWQFNIRTQIHSTIIFISLFSFVVIGIVTILFFINRYQNNNKESLGRTIKILENEVGNSLQEVDQQKDTVKIYNEGAQEKLQAAIAKISEIHSVDINVYDLNGNLQVSSLPLPYNKGIISNRMDPTAYYHLALQKRVQYFKEDKMGSLKFLSSYVPVTDKNGKAYAYLNIPYFTSAGKLKVEIANFLVTLINLNAFIFLIAGVVALFITNRITRAFSFISNRMKEINLGKINEPIVWKKNDEIGELVMEYNKMVGQLNNSATALAKSEREGAWREMARQVAHEIKNPLTPMKLSLQYLQRAINNNAPNVNELTKNVTQTLVEQIDILNKIAGEFSQFANIGNPHLQVFDLHEVLFLITQLYSVNDKVQLHYFNLSTPIFINADKTHITRLFTNLIQNALQAVKENEMAIIEITEKIKDNTVVVQIKDNGVGIPTTVQPKIFTPNFTTKTSGTGLGLAMCKGIVEQAGGHIGFSTKENEGTTFFVELPLAQ